MGVEAEQAKPIRVILIGADCTGKTVLANLLREHYEVSGKGNRRLPGDLEAVREVINYALDVMPNTEFILDQWQYPVDIVYQHALEGRRSPMLDIEDLLTSHLIKHGVLYIYLTADSETVSHRYYLRGDELWNLEQILRVRGYYEKFMRNFPVPYRRIDTSDKTPLEVFKDAKMYIDKFFGR